MPTSGPDARNPADRLEERLREGHWRLVRQQGGHPVYKRAVLYEAEAETTEQTFSHAATPSDWRSMLNSLSDLRALDSGVVQALPSADAGQAAGFARLRECHRRRKELEGELERTQEDICMLESECGYE